MSNNKNRICIIGLWHQGVVGAACMAHLGYSVIGADYHADRVESLNRGKSPIYEPGLNDLLLEGLSSHKLQFTTNVGDAVSGCRYVMLMHDTPVNDKDQSDLDELFRAVDDIIPYLDSEAILYVTAQVPVGTCDRIMSLIHNKQPLLNVSIAYSPENLRLGQAIERFLKPPLPVIGADNLSTAEKVKELMEPLNAEWRIVDIRTAEMSKHALNAFIALSICLGNEIGELCEHVGADGRQVAAVLRMEERIGKKAMLMPGLAFAGGTLARDIQTLRSLGDHHGIDTFLLDGAWKRNKKQNESIIKKIKKLYDTIAGLRVAVLGLTYKADTSTLRRSAAIEIIRSLIQEGAIISAHDPKADREELKLYDGLFTFHEDPYDAAYDAKMILLMTGWKDYETIELKKLKKVMLIQPAIFDTANLWDEAQIKESGFEYLGIGIGTKQ